MGGSGSGRHWHWDKKDTVESNRALDIRILQRDGCLNPGYIYTVTWRDSQGNKKASIGVQSYPDTIRIFYTLNPSEADAKDISYFVPIDRTPCNYGNDRPWFVCPGKNCGRRVAILYLKNSYFLCRHCHNLAYESQHVSEMFRLQSEAQKLRVKLGGSGSMAEPFPAKPKGMHWKTYWRLRQKSLDAEDASWMAVGKWMKLWAR